MKRFLNILIIVFGLIFAIGMSACQQSQNTNNTNPSQPSSNPGSTQSPGSGTNSPGTNTTVTVTSIDIINAVTSLLAGETLQIEVEVKDQNGNIISNDNVTFQLSNNGLATISASGLLEALYPGTFTVTATKDGISSTPFSITIDPTDNSLTIDQLTDNDNDDTWGDNNFWKTISRGRILYRTEDFNTGDFLINIIDDDGNNLFQQIVINGADFLAMGSGDDDDNFLASWREDLATTMVYDSDSGNTLDLGQNNQEENSIDDGCLFYRDSSDQNDHLITLFSLGNGGGRVSDIGGMDRDVISSDCQAVWTRDNQLVFYDGNQQNLIENGPIFFSQYDLRHGQIIYSKDGDIFHVDTTTAPYTVNQLTTDGLAVIDSYPKTDGKSIVWIKDNTEVVLHDIATGKTETISITNNIKFVGTLQIDGKQVVWQEDQTAFFFHDGTGTANGTTEIIPTIATTVNMPYIDEGIVTFYGQTGNFTDNEIFVMK